MTNRAKKLRRDLYELSKANGGYHYGGTFSCVEILLALYDYILTPSDRFILSKGHGCWGYYQLLRERNLNPGLEGHPCLDVANGVHWTTGSEGHGLPAAVGMALARKVQKRGGEIYVLMGDGECQEGTTWESLLMAAHHKLDNLVVIVDNNGIQGSGRVADILPVINVLRNAAVSAGWAVYSVDEGHDVEILKNWIVIKQINTTPKPRMIIAHTVKGKGVSFMEDNPAWHANWPNAEHEKILLEELA